MSAFDTHGLMAQNGGIITPSDSVDSLTYSGFWLENDGTVKMTYRKRDNSLGNTVTVNLLAGYHPRRIAKVFATGSSITGIIEGLEG